MSLKAYRICLALSFSLLSLKAIAHDEVNLSCRGSGNSGDELVNEAWINIDRQLDRAHLAELSEGGFAQSECSLLVTAKIYLLLCEGQTVTVDRVQLKAATTAHDGSSTGRLYECEEMDLKI